MSLNLELKNLETRILWILSTGHLTEAERMGQFDESSSPIIQGITDYFISFYVNPDVEAIKEKGLSPHMEAVFLEANRLGIVEIRFDADGEIIEGLPLFP